jgi:hypothetical protein
VVVIRRCGSLWRGNGIVSPSFPHYVSVCVCIQAADSELLVDRLSPESKSREVSLLKGAATYLSKPGMLFTDSHRLGRGYIDGLLSC